MMAWGVAYAAHVDNATARTVAENYMRLQGFKTPELLVDVSASVPYGEFYIFSCDKGGFVIVAADDCVIPILGYSTISPFSAHNLPVNAREWFENLEEEIRLCRENARDNYENAWNLLLTGNVPEDPLHSSVSPLLTTTWNQSPYYNNQCPYDNTYGERTVTGCVATATAQIMKYWGHPSSGHGSNSYYTDDYGTISQATMNSSSALASALNQQFNNNYYYWRAQNE